MLPCALGGQEPIQSCSGERGVENEAGLDRQAPVRAIAVQREQEGQTADEMRRDDLHQQPPLVVSLANEADVAEPEVPEAAVYELRGSA